MCFRPCSTFSSLYLSSHLSMFRCFGYFFVDRFHWLQHYYTFGLQSLWTISHIRTLRHHFYPSNVTTTYTSPTTPIKKEKNFALHSQDLVRLCITLIWLRLCSPALLDLVPHHTLTLTHCILPRSTALFLVYDLYWAGYHPFTPFSHRSFATGTDLPGLSQLLDHF